MKLLVLVSMLLSPYIWGQVTNGSGNPVLNGNGEPVKSGSDQESPKPSLGGGVVGMTGGGFPGSGNGGLSLGGGFGSFSGGISQSNEPEEGDIDLAGANSLNVNCMPKEGNFACGECETELQDDFNSLIADITGAGKGTDGHWGGDLTKKRSIREGVTLEDTLSKIKAMLKKSNKGGGEGLNFIVIGESESLQPSAVRDGKMYPRVALKSPNSELWVTFSTDPANAAYSTLEIMRWNGKDAKYEFMELDFNPKHRHMDGTGEKCLSCHKEPDPRPNWDTYRAWAGVVPSRDDMLEMYPQGKKKPVTLNPIAAHMGQDAKVAHQQMKPDMGADGRAYLSFLDQVVDAKEKDPKSRLAMLDLPVDDRVQFQGQNPPVSSLPPRQQLEAIKKKTEESGFYRIPHFPYADEMRAQNFDFKTASYTGPSQAAFDQMSGQNFCRISTRLKEHPNYDKFKYYLAGVANRCISPDPKRMKEWIPESMQSKIHSFYKESPETRLRNLALAKRTPTQLNGFDDTVKAINDDTGENHSRADQFKVKRHERFLESYLKEVENGSAKDIQEEAEEFSNKLKTPVRSGFHAIEDFGGVNGVAEAHQRDITAIRAVLEPLGVDVTQWSMMRGDDPNYNSLAFSDQFSLLYQQGAIREVIAEIKKDTSSGNTCEKLKTRSYQALVTDEVKQEVANPVTNDVESWCRDRMTNEALGESMGVLDSMKSLFQVNKAMLKEEAQSLTVKCLDCHGSAGFYPFPGMNKLISNGPYLIQTAGPWTDEAWSEFDGFLRGGAGAKPFGLAMIEKMILKKMPPGGWPHSGSNEEKTKEDDRRREVLANYVRLTMVTSFDDSVVKRYCESVTNSFAAEKGPMAPAATPSNSGATPQ